MSATPAVLVALQLAGYPCDMLPTGEIVTTINHQAVQITVEDF